MNHINTTNKRNCCGCTACASICPKNAIEMKPDVFGFQFPHVDEARCVDCGLCLSVCSFNEDYDKSLNLLKPDYYGLRHKDLDEVANSQSGGAFVLLTDWIIENGGVVYGVGYRDHFKVTHKRAENIIERNEFRGSKYVQSDLTGIFQQIRQDLTNGLIVCFSGTPCQTAGLNSYIGNKLRQKLYLIDLVCHGVPGPKMWEDYLEYLEHKEGKKLLKVNFRDKRIKGWKSHVESFLFEGDTYYTYYTHTFYSHINIRHSCNFCYFCNTKRPSDITIGDFWGVEKNSKTFAEDNKGCSLILVNTEKGRNWFSEIKKNANILIPKSLETCLQPQLCKPSRINPRRDAFEEDYAMYGFERTMKKYGFIGWKNTSIQLLKSLYRALKGAI